jgi:hypothetical protein
MYAESISVLLKVRVVANPTPTATQRVPGRRGEGLGWGL